MRTLFKWSSHRWSLLYIVACVRICQKRTDFYGPLNCATIGKHLLFEFCDFFASPGVFFKNDLRILQSGNVHDAHLFWSFTLCCDRIFVSLAPFETVTLSLVCPTKQICGRRVRNDRLLMLTENMNQASQGRNHILMCIRKTMFRRSHQTSVKCNECRRRRLARLVTTVHSSLV